MEIGAKPACQDGQRGRRSGRGGVLLGNSRADARASVSAHGRTDARRVDHTVLEGWGLALVAEDDRGHGHGRCSWATISRVPNAPSVSHVIR